MITRSSISSVNLNIDIFYSPLTDRDTFWVWVCKVWLHLCRLFFGAIFENVCNLDEKHLECWHCIISASLFFVLLRSWSDIDGSQVRQSTAVSHGRGKPSGRQHCWTRRIPCRDWRQASSHFTLVMDGRTASRSFGGISTSSTSSASI